jgi:hypothetical protein
MTKSKKNDDKKRIERQSLLLFLKAAKFDFDPDNIKDGTDHDGMPDFLIHANGQHLGFELRRAFKDSKGHENEQSSYKTKESHSERRLKSLTMEYYSQPDAISIKVRFDTWIPSKTVKLLQLLKFHALSISEFVTKSIEFENTQIDITRLPAESKTHCFWDVRSESVGWISELDLDTLKRIIKSKEKKVAGYKRHSDIIYLLIYSEFAGVSSFFTLPKISKDLINSYFDKIYFFCHINGVIEIK